ncbi:MAG: threonine/serine dehydratase [Pyrinomonadaceae bacterium]|nr:threonine/serine dehydratase [Pyrinomonadaceae bacterium]
MKIPEEVKKAYARISSHVRETRLEKSEFYNELSGANVFLKLENLQHTGSFKVRGAMNKILSLSDEELSRGVVTASTGNHGAAVAFSLDKIRAKGTVFVSPKASSSKIEAIKRLGTEVREYGDDPIEAENYARKYADENNLVYISPYNDPKTVGGQGTVGVELENQLDQIDAVFIAVGGGGLISGVGGYLKSVNPDVQIIGCSPENSQVMIESIKMGKLIGDLPSIPTLSDGTAGGIEDESITFEPCQELVDKWVTVTEDEIRQNLIEFMDSHHMLIEGAAAVAIAAFLKTKEKYAGKNVVLVLCGANIGVETLKEVLS